MADISFGNGQTVTAQQQATNDTYQNTGLAPSTLSAYTPPNTSAPTSGASIVNGGPLNFSPAAPTDNGSSLVAGVVAGQNYSNPPPTDGSSTPALDSATKAYNDSSAAYQADIAQTPDESTMLSSAENAAGTPGMKSQIDQLKTDLASTTAAYNNQYQNIGTQGVESGTPGVFYQGEQAAQQRQASVVIAGKAAILSALQGNYDSAETLAKQTADMQFKAAEDKITNAYNFLKLNQDTLTKAQADAIKTQTTAQAAIVTQNKANVTQALANGVQTQFWTDANGTVINTATGQEYSTPTEAFAAGVLPDFSNAPKIQPIGKTEDKKIGSQTYHIVYAKNGIDVISKTLISGNPTPTDNSGGGYTVASASQEINDQWKQGYIQGNGKVASSDYKTAKAWWTQQKDSKGKYLTATSFDQQFANLIDQSSKTWKADYGYKGN